MSLLQALPLISDESVEILERNIMELPSVTSLLIQGKTPAEITNMILRDIEASPGADEIVPTCVSLCSLPVSPLLPFTLATSNRKGLLLVLLSRPPRGTGLVLRLVSLGLAQEGRALLWPGHRKPG